MNRRLLDNITFRQRFFHRSNYTTYIIIIVIVFLTLVGEPKFIFQSHLHIPWLTDVKHVQPLQCISDKNQPGWPRAMESSEKSPLDGHLTLIIVSAKSDFKRLPLTLTSLVCHLDYRQLNQVILLVPRQHATLLEPFLVGEASRHWPWPISIMPDDNILQHTHTHSYRLQMMFKLVIAQVIKTEYYMILDSDCIALSPIHVTQLLWQQNMSSSKVSHGIPSHQALYQLEERSDHAEWWPESEQLLQIEPNTCVTNNPSTKSIGVTPAILSKSIALMTLCRLQKLYGDRSFLNILANWALWRTPFGRMWTEYTLYYLTARCTDTFNSHHFHRANTSSVPPINLYGPSVWWATDWTSFLRYQLLDSAKAGLQWRQKEIDNGDGASIIDSSVKAINLFTVLQSRATVNQALFHTLLYPLFIDHLAHRKNSQKLLEILNRMTTQFTGNSNTDGIH
ncbi:unnamed protein product [Rotaria socialis]|uniref:Uncharacterized protein n=1 Tax=Rotaria socialis TaxID=392032 RepID=A0A818I105_9BILA|nr:unnamed protein product [Rotaria socialis]CAF4614119.1 unnamed protein product [Rotaria socialis]